MKCAFCGGETKATMVTFEHEHAGRIILVEHVPSEVCGACGEKTYSPDVADKLTRIASSNGKPARVLEVPVYDFAQSA